MKKIILGIILGVLFSSVGTVFAQQATIGNPPTQIVKITIDEDGSAHVIHVVEPSIQPQQVTVIQNNFTNLQIKEENGYIPQYGEVSGNVKSFMLFPTDKRTLIEYDLKNVVKLKDGMWRWDYVYLAETKFYLPEDANLIFTNETPINLAEKRGVNCHGCQVKLEYELGQTEIVKQVQWQDKKFDVRIITLADISSFKFDQPNKKITFDVNDENKYVTLIIPLELLWNPYQVLLNGNTTLDNEFYSDGKTMWLGIKPDKVGTVEIIGVSAVPEFPLVSLLIFGSAMVVAVRYKNKFSLR
ncbi:hypothetical protein [Candidatus Nitrosotenuis chungbukensis]|uniref:hypothetical protein n=1 Tax=Candidatus Nitrosotenuis chungbukensis TaxID=1353246 RepID=UPI000693C444|nr:hypothetical protein [Candidatus Nitrosotenuis chungbukensis]